MKYIDLDGLQTDFFAYIESIKNESQAYKLDTNMSEIGDIESLILESENYLRQFATGEKPTIKEKALSHLANIPMIGGYAKSKYEETRNQNIKNSTVREALKKIFDPLKSKKDRLIHFSDMLHEMKKSLVSQETKLRFYIENINNMVEDSSGSDKLKAIDMSNIAMSQLQRVQDSINNKADILITLIEELYRKLSEKIPMIENALDDSLQYVAVINTLREQVEMMNRVEMLGNDIEKISTQQIQKSIIEVISMDTTSANIEHFKNSAKRNEEFNKLYIEHSQKRIQKIVENHNTLKSIANDMSNQLTYRGNQETIYLENLTREGK